MAANAVDDDASTRYSSGTGQQPGQYLQVDFGRPDPVRQIVFDTGASTGDFPRGYAVDGQHRRHALVTAVADGAGTGQFVPSDSTARRSDTYGSR